MTVQGQKELCHRPALMVTGLYTAGSAVLTTMCETALRRILCNIETKQFISDVPSLTFLL